MKNNLLTILFLFFATNLTAQVNTSWQWIWVSGDTSTNALGVYGTQGVPDPSNKPGARWHTTSWTDIGGNLWLYGGDGYGSTSSITILGDLWKYNLTTNEWTWVKGGNIGFEQRVYGNKGVGNDANTPGARQNADSWTDADGNFWLFGGTGYDSSAALLGPLNDLWKYIPSTNQWTWVKGDSVFSITGDYGTQGVPSPANKPGARVSGVSWRDAAGNLWLFGGRKYNSSSFIFNDLWKYDISTNEWVWMKGSSTIAFNGVYGTKGVPDIANTPGPRTDASTWTDANGDFWLFGGTGYASQLGSSGILNDLWRYNIATNTWTWMSGTDITNQAAVYGNIGVPGVNNIPASRRSCTAWLDTEGKLLLFGGYGYATNTTFIGYLNDMWKYDITAGTWEWIRGDSVVTKPGNHGTQGMQNITNKPGGKTSATGWQDANGNLWLFGGFGTALSFSGTIITGVMNDLWKLAPAGVVGLRFLQFNALLNDKAVMLEWQTAEESNTGYFNIQRSTDGVHFENIGREQAAGNSSILNYQFHDTTAFQKGGAQLFYRLQEVDKDNKSYYSGIVKVAIKINRLNISKVYPNPAKNVLQYSVDAEERTSLQMVLYNFSGKLLLQKTIEVQKGNTKMRQEISKLTSGTYTLLFIDGKDGNKWKQTFIKM